METPTVGNETRQTAADRRRATDELRREIVAHLVGDLEQQAKWLDQTTAQLRPGLTDELDDAGRRALADALLFRFRSGHLEAVAVMHALKTWYDVGARSWAAFCRDELGISKSRSYQLIAYGRTRQLLALGVDPASAPDDADHRAEEQGQ